MQMIEEGGDSHWAGEDDIESGLRIGVSRDLRTRPNPVFHPDGAAVAGLRKLFWPTYTDFENGIAKDEEAFRALLDRPRKAISDYSTPNVPMLI